MKHPTAPSPTPFIVALSLLTLNAWGCSGPESAPDSNHATVSTSDNESEGRAFFDSLFTDIYEKYARLSEPARINFRKTETMERMANELMDALHNLRESAQDFSHGGPEAFVDKLAGLGFHKSPKAVALFYFAVGSEHKSALYRLQEVIKTKLGSEQFKAMLKLAEPFNEYFYGPKNEWAANPHATLFVGRFLDFWLKNDVLRKIAEKCKRTGTKTGDLFAKPFEYLPQAFAMQLSGFLIDKTKNREALKNVPNVRAAASDLDGAEFDSRYALASALKKLNTPLKQLHDLKNWFSLRHEIIRDGNPRLAPSDMRSLCTEVASQLSQPALDPSEGGLRPSELLKITVLALNNGYTNLEQFAKSADLTESVAYLLILHQLKTEGFIQWIEDGIGPEALKGAVQKHGGNPETQQQIITVMADAVDRIEKRMRYSGYDCEYSQDVFKRYASSALAVRDQLRQLLP